MVDGLISKGAGACFDVGGENLISSSAHSFNRLQKVSLRRLGGAELDLCRRLQVTWELHKASHTDPWSNPFQEDPITSDIEAADMFSTVHQLHQELTDLKFEPSHPVEDINQNYEPIIINMSTLDFKQRQVSDAQRPSAEESEAEWKKYKPTNIKDRKDDDGSGGKREKSVVNVEEDDEWLNE